MSEPDAFNPYEYLARIKGETEGERVMLTDSYRATDIGTLIKTALIAIEILSEKVNAMEAAKAKPGEGD